METISIGANKIGWKVFNDAMATDRNVMLFTLNMELNMTHRSDCDDGNIHKSNVRKINREKFKSILKLPVSPPNVDLN